MESAFTCFKVFGTRDEAQSLSFWHVFSNKTIRNYTAKCFLWYCTVSMSCQVVVLTNETFRPSVWSQMKTCWCCFIYCFIRYQDSFTQTFVIYWLLTAWINNEFEKLISRVLMPWSEELTSLRVGFSLKNSVLILLWGGSNWKARNIPW